MLVIIFFITLYFSLIGSFSTNLRVRKILKLSIDWEFYILILMITNFLLMCWFFGGAIFYVMGLGYLYGILIGSILWFISILIITSPLPFIIMICYKIIQIIYSIINRK